MNKSKEEIEVIYLEVNKEKLEKQLVSIGATKVKDFHYRYSAYDYPDARLNKDNAWIRLRDEDEKIVLAYKKRIGVTSQDGSTNDAGMEEIEMIVDDYENAKMFLLKSGFVEKHEGEKKRSRWRKGNVFFDIDSWPQIPTYLEIEATSWEEIDVVTNELGFKKEDRKICSAKQIYMLYGMNIDDYQKIRFNGMVKKTK